MSEAPGSQKVRTVKIDDNKDAYYADFQGYPWKEIRHYSLDDLLAGRFTANKAKLQYVLVDILICIIGCVYVPVTGDSQADTRAPCPPCRTNYYRTADEARTARAKRVENWYADPKEVEPENPADLLLCFCNGFKVGALRNFTPEQLQEGARNMVSCSLLQCRHAHADVPLLKRNCDYCRCSRTLPQHQLLLRLCAIQHRRPCKAPETATSTRPTTLGCLQPSAPMMVLFLVSSSMGVVLLLFLLPR